MKNVTMQKIYQTSDLYLAAWLLSQGLILEVIEPDGHKPLQLALWGGSGEG